MRKQPMDSLFSSMALWRRVCWHFPGPSDQRSTSHPCFTYKSNRKMYMYMFYNSASVICIITGTLFKYTSSWNAQKRWISYWKKNGFFLKHYKGILFPHMPYNTWNIQINNHLLVNLLCHYILPGLVLHPPGQNLMPATTDSLHLYF